MPEGRRAVHRSFGGSWVNYPRAESLG
ncbi:hypothetical protein BOSE29B_110709 [Bosea sp. 29B]|nr:hypothetical protein BOSE29B_110709 [Bosea sp. 29B]